MKRCEANGIDPALPHLNSYWAGRDQRAREAKADAHQRAITNARYDIGLAPLNAKQAARWADDTRASHEGNEQ